MAGKILLFPSLFVLFIFASAHRPLVDEELPASEPIPSVSMDDMGMVTVDVNKVKMDSNGKVKLDSNGKVKLDSNGKVKMDSNGKVKLDSNGKVKVGWTQSENGQVRTERDMVKGEEKGTRMVNGDVKDGFRSGNGNPGTVGRMMRSDDTSRVEHKTDIVMGKVAGEPKPPSMNSKLRSHGDNDKVVMGTRNVKGESPASEDKNARGEIPTIDENIASGLRTGSDEKIDMDNPVRPVTPAEPFPGPGGDGGFHFNLGPIGFGAGWQFGIPGGMFMPPYPPYIVVSPYTPSPSGAGYSLPSEGYFVPAGTYGVGSYYSDYP